MQKQYPQSACYWRKVIKKMLQVNVLLIFMCILCVFKLFTRHQDVSRKTNINKKSKNTSTILCIFCPLLSICCNTARWSTNWSKSVILQIRQRRNWLKPVVILTNINKIILNTVHDQIINRIRWKNNIFTSLRWL